MLFGRIISVSFKASPNELQELFVCAASHWKPMICCRGSFKNHVVKRSVKTFASPLMAKSNGWGDVLGVKLLRVTELKRD